MISNNTKKLLLFITLLIFLIGIVSATDESKCPSTIDDTIAQQTTDSVNTASEIKEDVISNNKKKIDDTNTEKNIKTSTNKIKTKVLIEPIPDVSVDELVLVFGTLTDINNKQLKDSEVRLNINGDNYYTDTDDYGDFFGEYFASTLGTKTVTVSYAGNNKYEPTSTKITFNVKGQATTYLELNDIKEVNNGQTTTISGQYYYGNFNPLPNTTLKININGKTYTTKTDKQGHYTYNHKTNKDGTNTVTVLYPGNKNYKAASTSKTFNVKSTGPKNTYLTLNNIKDVAYGESITISGKYYYGNNISLPNTTLKININGKTYTTKTDKQGHYTYNHKTNKVGKNTITVTYPGNKNYKKATNTQTFNVKITSPIPTYITLNSVKEVNNGQTTTISGQYYYSNNIPLPNTTLKININGKTYTTKTDKQGHYTYNHKTNKDGTNIVTVSYSGNKNYKKASTSTSFNVKSVGPKNTYITLNYIDDTTLNDYVTISGYYYHSNNVPLPNTSLKLNINGKTYTTKTDKQGYYSYNYKVNKLGTNTVTVTYPGNKNYKKATTTTTFYVKKPVYTLELKTQSTKTYDLDIVYLKGDPFVSFYETSNYAQYDRGVYVEIDTRGLSQPPHYEIIKVTFYFQNNYDGSIYTKTIDDVEWEGTFVQTNMINGYTPYKAIVYYSPLTDAERRNYPW